MQTHSKNMATKKTMPARVRECSVCGSKATGMLTECAEYKKTGAVELCFEWVCKGGHEKNHFCPQHRNADNDCCILNCCGDRLNDEADGATHTDSDKEAGDNEEEEEVTAGEEMDSGGEEEVTLLAELEQKWNKLCLSTASKPPRRS